MAHDWSVFFATVAVFIVAVRIIENVPVWFDAWLLKRDKDLLKRLYGE
jgi:hypothetical protein